MTFTGAPLTDLGKALNAKIQAATGKIPLEITHVVLGAGTSPTPTSQTDVIDPIDFFVPIIRQTSHDNVAEIQIQITNVGNPDLAIPPLATGMPFQQIGFFAIDPDLGKILYRISQLSDTGFIPPASTLPYTLNPIYIFTTANAEKVIITVDPAGLVTIRMLEDHTHRTLFSENGVHGTRFWNGRWQFGSGGDNDWEDDNAGQYFERVIANWTEIGYIGVPLAVMVGNVLAAERFNTVTVGTTKITVS